MSVQYKFFHVSAHGMDGAESELNRFLASVRVVHVQRELVDCRENSFWAIAVEYLNGPVSEFPKLTGLCGRRLADQGGNPVPDYRIKSKDVIPGLVTGVFG